MKIPFLDLKQVNAPYMDALKDAASAVVESAGTSAVPIANASRRNLPPTPVLRMG